MDVFLLNNIIPKLALCLNEFSINPKQQDIGKLFDQVVLILTDSL